MELQDALVAARQGRALAFLGSGYTYGANAANGLAVPTTLQLAQRLCEALKESEPLPFDVAAGLYRRRHPQDPYALASFLAEQFRVTEAEEPHLSFAKVPWKRVYTTNYDNLVEISSTKLGIERLPISTAFPPEHYDASKAWIVHLHGFPAEMIKAAPQAPIVLDKPSYVRLELMKTAWPTRLQADLARADAIFVVGFSFDDLHIARLFREAPSLRRKTFVIIKPSASEGLKEAASDYGRVLDIGVSGIAKMLDSVDLSKVPDLRPAEIVSFQEITLPETPREPKSEDVFSLLIGGHFDHSVYLHTLTNPEIPYAFKRNYALRQIAQPSETPRRFLITSRIGNGKSVFVRELAVQFAKDGYRVFMGLHPVSGIADEVDSLRSERKPLVFIYEGAREYEAAIKTVSSLMQARDVLLVGTRPASFAGDFDNLKNIVGEGFRRLDLDTLTEGDISEVQNLLEFYGIWGKSAGPTSESRRKFIRSNCGAEPRSVFLHLFKDSAISGRIEAPVQKLLAEGGSMPSLFAALLVSRFADCPLDFHDVCDLMDCEPTDVHAAFASTGVSDLFQDADADFKARSPILAEHLLAEILPGPLVLESIAFLIERLVAFRLADERFDESIPRILRFAGITRLFKNRTRRPLLEVLYERVLRIGYIREDPQFWLQLAMARLESAQWLETERALETAYQKAKARPSYRAYMLHNQMARFLLVSGAAGYQADLDECAIKACELMSARMTERGGEIDIYAYRLVDPLLHFRNLKGAELGAGAKSVVTTTLDQARSALAAARQRRELDHEEERVWRTLK
jgi:hypothetical protein